MGFSLYNDLNIIIHHSNLGWTNDIDFASLLHKDFAFDYTFICQSTNFVLFHICALVHISECDF